MVQEILLRLQKPQQLGKIRLAYNWESQDCASSYRGKSDELNILQSCVVHHFHNLSKTFYLA